MERKVAERVRAQRWYLRFPRTMPVAIFLLVSAITALSVYAIEQVESQRTEALHRQTALSAGTALERLASANEIYLRAGAALLSMQPQITRAAFREYAGQLYSDATLRGGGAVVWMAPVAPAQRSAFEAAARADGLAGYRIYPAPQGEPLMPVLFAQPEQAVAPDVLGYNAMSEPLRRDAIERAIRSGQPAASALLDLESAPGAGRHAGFALFMPVFRGQGVERRLTGVLARGFNAQGFIEAALGPEQAHGYGVALYDDMAGAPNLVAVLGPQGPKNARIVTQARVGDRLMRVEVSPPVGTALSNLSLLTLLFGMMVAALLLVVARLITQQAAEDRAALAWFEEQASIRNSLTRELNHRVKNTLANVLSIVSLTRRRTSSIDDFVEGLIGRVRALSATHDLLTQSEWGTTPVRAVVVAELAPYTHDGDRAVEMRGPSVELAPNDALSLGLAIHELATNASKYGALSVAGGQVEVSWEMITDKLARIDWREHGGPGVVMHNRRRGFGTELIEKIVAHELKNPVDLRFEPDGVRCTLIVPVRSPAPFQLRGGGEGEE